MMINLGNDNFIREDCITGVLSPDSTRAKWIAREATEGCKLVNCSRGKKINALIILKTKHVFLSYKTIEELNLKQFQTD